jgi:hypothetical protein
MPIVSADQFFGQGSKPATDDAPLRPVFGPGGYEKVLNQYGELKNPAGAEPMRLSEPTAKKTVSAQDFMGAKAAEPAADFFTPGAGKWEPPSAPITAGGMFDAFMNKAITEGGPAIAGLPADAIYGARWLARKAGLPTVETPLPGSQEIGDAVKQFVPERQPQNVAEEYAGTAGAFAPAAIFGAGGLARRAAQVAVPAAFSETGGQIGRQFSPEAEVAGRVGGALLGGRGVTKPRTPKGPANSEAVKDISQAAYDRAEAAGLKIKGDSFSNFVQSLSNDKVVKSLNLDPALHPHLTALGRDFEKHVIKQPSQPAMGALTGKTRTANIKDLGIDEFDNLRRGALKGLRSTDADERRIARHMVDRMDAYFNTLKTKDVAAGNVREAQQAVKEARENWRKYRKSDQIDTIMEVAKDRAGQFSVSGNENAIRTGFRQLSTKIAKDPREANKWTKDEKKLIRQLSRGWHSRDALKNIGAVLNNPISRSIYGTGAGYATYDSGGDPNAAMFAAAAFLAGKASRGLSGAMAGAKVKQLSNTVRGGGNALPGGRGIIPLQAGIAFEDQ